MKVNYVWSTPEVYRQRLWDCLIGKSKHGCIFNTSQNEYYCLFCPTSWVILKQLDPSPSKAKLTIRQRYCHLSSTINDKDDENDDDDDDGNNKQKNGINPFCAGT